MKKSFVFIFTVFLGLLFIFASDPGPKPVNLKDLDLRAKPLETQVGAGVKPDINFGRIPLYFISNKGQVNEKAKFYAKASKYTLWLTKEGLVFDSTHPAPSRHPSQEGNNRVFPHSPDSPYSTHSPKLERDVSRLIFLNANKNPEMVPIDEAKLKVNYFIGNDKSKWNCDIPTSMAVLYKNLYKNIDLKVYGIEKQIEYDWIVKPGGDPGEIKVEYRNVIGTRIDDEGNLLIETDFGELMHKRPVSYQMRTAQSARRKAQSAERRAHSAQRNAQNACPKDRKYVNVTFKKIAKYTCGFEVGTYNKSRELIIDPVVLAYSTYLGGGDEDWDGRIAVDGSGHAYVTGTTNSMDFPTLNEYQADQGFHDVFVTKLDPNQSGAASLLYSTYLGGGGGEFGGGIVVDNIGNVYVTGYTGSTDFPTLNQYQGYQGLLDVFVTKLDATQSGAASLLYSTYLGGERDDFGYGISVDGSGNAYVTGYTTSWEFPTLNQYQGSQGVIDAFVTKLDLTQSGTASLLYSTYLGGGNEDYGYCIAVDGSGNAYVTGITESLDFPILNQYQGDQGTSDAFVTKLDPTRSGTASLLYSTYLGGVGGDYGYGIAVDVSGNAYVAGYTESPDFPTLNQYHGYQGGTDVFVTKLDLTQSGAASLLYSTYLGGGSSDYGGGIAVDLSGSAYVAGQTLSTDFPTLNQYQGYQGDHDVFVTKLDLTQSGSSSLLYSTYLGGGNRDSGYGITVDGSGNAYVMGSTWSPDFPTLNQYQGYQGGTDVFVTKLSFVPIAPPTVDTTIISNITYTTATLGGNVSDIGGAIITERGVYWSTTNGFTPPGQGTKVSETGNWGTGTFTVNVTGLPAGTTIYFIAFATNSAGTGYSAQASFTTPAVTVPTVTTIVVSNVTSTSAKSGGNVTSDGGGAVTARGVCWSTSSNPTTADSTTSNGTGTGRFTSNITGLIENTTYYLRAYATNSVGTGYGKQRRFTTKAESVTVTITEPQDGAQVSGTVTIKATVTANAAKAADASIQAVEKVEFYVDDVKIAEDSSEPYEITWDSTTVADGSHTIKAVAYNAANQACQDQITVQVGNTPPEILLNRTHLNYGSIPQAGTASVSLNSTNFTTGSQTILINNTGGGTLNWTAGKDADWLTFTPESGTGRGAVTVTVDPSGLPTGTYNATISIQDPNASNSPQAVPVVLKVYGSGTTTIPFGYFETPIDGTTVMSSIPVTGWALDDIDINSVKIYRAPIPGHETGGLVYIGDAVMVDGARPDVEQQFLTYPKDYQAGWGYMMLTNYLPFQGNGTFTIYAKARDKEGNEVTLGNKTIICDNANAVKPFGAIDTPDQGGTVSGSAYINFGWALTPRPNKIPIDGSTIMVWVDGVPLGRPVYNKNRKDIVELFPGYQNSNGAGGHFYLNTTVYLNGVHTIAWSVQDNAGNQDGIGSRYFTIVNTGGANISGMESNDKQLRQPQYLSVSHINRAARSTGPVLVTKGYDRKSGFQLLYPDHEGIITVQSREDQRIELLLKSGLLSDDSVFSGYLIRGNQLQLLPIGSTLDNRSGIFYWHPCAGFLGLYRFVFLEKAADGQVTRKLLKVVISPK